MKEIRGPAIFLAQFLADASGKIDHIREDRRQHVGPCATAVQLPPIRVPKDNLSFFPSFPLFFPPQSFLSPRR